MDKRHHRMVWIDLEMTGLDIGRESIIEIAIVVSTATSTCWQLDPTSPSKWMKRCWLEWTTGTHAITIAAASWTASAQRASALAKRNKRPLFLREWVDENTAPLCGNSVWNDRQFMAKEMPGTPRLPSLPHGDVSTIKALAKRWYRDVPRFSKKGAHLALDDILESIDEFRVLPRAGVQASA